MKNLEQLVRPNIWTLKPYSSARDEYKGVQATLFLDANESPYNSSFNRYPDPLQEEVKKLLAPIKKVQENQIFLGNGSDEAIDIVFRTFCVPQVDNVVAIAPTYGMYEVCADINDVEYRKVPLNSDFQFSAQELLKATDERTKAIFLCSPNNPTGNLLLRNEIEYVLTHFDGLVVIDEAYADFSLEPPFHYLLDQYPNLIVLNTFSKAWASAAIRLGIAIASPAIIALFNKVKYPYNVNQLTQVQARAILKNHYYVEQWIKLILDERASMMKALSQLTLCKRVYPSDANFILAKMQDADKLYTYLMNEGIIVRNRSHIELCEDCLRITIGTPQENAELLRALCKYEYCKL